ncbi:PREDICTED: importin subunit alpha-7 [Tarenaya hassleriana]|uniref:importin subunit alpha-7 n=1 Tax=Tarenaya hassleriana TaxID=28532 RepID=UPI00053C3FCF|nr:PREDICTED: importin subunit alpha-7 [Tarenaya hassleriana]
MSQRTSWRTEVRRSHYKAVVDGDKGRRRREDEMVEIRKAKRDECLAKKRRESTPNALSVEKLECFPTLVAYVWSDNKDLLLEATTQIRASLCSESFAVRVEEVIQAGLVPRFVEFLIWDDFPQLQFEAAWALTNIASGTSENTEVVIDHGAVPILVRLLNSPNNDVREQAVWALGNISGDSPRCRDIVLGHGALLPLLLQLDDSPRLSLLRNASWTLSNFFRGKPQPPLDRVSAVFPALARLIRSDDKEVLTNACWALSYLSDGTNEKIQAIIEAKLCARLIGLMAHSSPSVVLPALRTIGNIVTGDDIQTQLVIDLHALPCFLKLLREPYNKTIKKEACWAISNITAGDRKQIQAVFDADICPVLINLLRNAECDVKKEAAWVICNATLGGCDRQITLLVDQGCIEPLCNLLTCSDPDIIMICLRALEKILKVGQSLCQDAEVNVNPHAQMIEDVEGLDKIESLQSHDNENIYDMAVKILETYWLEEGEEGQQDMMVFTTDDDTE